MALEELRKEIEHEANADASTLEKESIAECERILSDARQVAVEAKKNAKEKATKEAEQKRSDALTAIDIESGSIISSAKEDCINSTTKQFLQIVERKLNAREQDIIKAAIKRFSLVVPPNNAVAKLDKRNANLLKASGIRVESSNVRGVFLSSEDGKVNTDATIDGLIRSNSESVRRILSKGMFG